MVFVWFSFGPDSLPLHASLLCAQRFAAKPGDSFVVCEEGGNPITEPIRGALLSRGVTFAQRSAIRNLNGSKGAVRMVIESMLTHADASGVVWKVDSDTMLLRPDWRDRFDGADLLGPQSPDDALVALGMSYMIRTASLQEILGRFATWENHSRGGWPEDAVISREARRGGARTSLLPFISGDWCAWSYKPTATSDSYRPYSVVSFGNRFRLTGSDTERRRKCGEAMIALLRERLRVDMPPAENGYRQS